MINPMTKTEQSPRNVIDLRSESDSECDQDFPSICVLDTQRAVAIEGTSGVHNWKIKEWVRRLFRGGLVEYEDYGSRFSPRRYLKFRSNEIAAEFTRRFALFPMPHKYARGSRAFLVDEEEIPKHGNRNPYFKTWPGRSVAKRNKKASKHYVEKDKIFGMSQMCI